MVDSSTYDRDSPPKSEFQHSDNEHELSMSERTTPVSQHLPQPYQNFGGLPNASFMSNHFALTNPHHLSSVAAAAASLNPLGLLQSGNSNLTSAYQGLDSLTMATALQSASLGVYNVNTRSMLASAPLNKYFDQFNNCRKRRRTKTPTPSDSSSSSNSEQVMTKSAKLAHSQPSSTSSNGGDGEKKDENYWDRRKKNNEAAKRSRDAKRMKEVHIARKAEFLERENVELKAQVSLLKSEAANLQYLLFNNRLASNASMHGSITATSPIASLGKCAAEVSRSV